MRHQDPLALPAVAISMVGKRRQHLAAESCYLHALLVA